jgi:hypothetical protein
MRGRSKFRLPKRVAEDLIERLKHDGDFLATIYGTMDYSLLGTSTTSSSSPCSHRHALRVLVGVYKKLIDSGLQTSSPSLDGDGLRLSETEEVDEIGNTRLQVWISLSLSEEDRPDQTLL